MSASSLTGAGAALEKGASQAPFQILASEEFIAESRAAFAELWMATADPLVTPLIASLQREGEWIMLLGYTFTRLSTIKAMARTRTSNNRHPIINWVCLMSFTCGVFYLLHRLGPSWPTSIAFWLYLMNIALTFVDLKLLNEFRTKERLSPISIAQRRKPTRVAPPAMDAATGFNDADRIAEVEREAPPAAGQDQLHDRIFALECDIAKLRREREVAASIPRPSDDDNFGDADDGNIFELDDAAHRPEPARPPVKLQSAEVIIKNLARRTVHSRAWKEIGLTDEVGHKVARRSLV